VRAEGVFCHHIFVMAAVNLDDRRKHLDADSADTKTILAILQIRQLGRHQPNGRNVPITAEILSPKNRDEAERQAEAAKSMSFPSDDGALNASISGIMPLPNPPDGWCASVPTNRLPLAILSP